MKSLENLEIGGEYGLYPTDPSTSGLLYRFHGLPCEPTVRDRY